MHTLAIVYPPNIAPYLKDIYSDFIVEQNKLKRK